MRTDKWQQKKKQEQRSYVAFDTKRDFTSFLCSGVKEDKTAIANLFNDFLLDLSDDHEVFFHAYRLSCADEPELIDPATIIARAKTLGNPAETFLYLRRAKLNSICFPRASSSAVYYFAEGAKWADFLVSFPFGVRHRKLMKKAVLSAYLASYGEGEDFYFRGNRVHEKKVLQLVEQLVNLGYEATSLKLMKFLSDSFD